ncbi:dihydroorotate dehydrogenase-like protein [Zoogloea sp.]|jgi:dihydroorotate dehydrogenase (fumarate)|uniref:dihydroorotate dehydrogenase-like protein n=1 Tax=Zoogloea sp. TaxID=49181 RepID=UPI0011DC56EC|nr:dihydroorotate dehydrogenase-like protein [Zoogloea sp.]MBK6654302.1 dihydroorotate dehydrogenase-like protein [Zoogloea sp.]MBK7849318.1 dihydroorotate dehydrogenase-like protein [Zoogloea sp.]MBP7446359.1 dihydroorotate dehydrogenase-like protein [Zoogloea sp.]TXG86940.1 MAG: dihydroorotate dehydrogenase-like protein [Zoogloea sp.]HOY01780.1 dihydroorotate dehydrogenase-like protein [Zoogloea sp.]
MIDLSTDYLGLRLKNPLVPSASPLSKSLDSLLLLEDAGAAAVVLHSLYEEELIAEDAMTERFLLNGELHDAEATGFLPDHGNFQGALERYLEHLRLAKARLDIPVIASLNGVTPSGWIDLGKELQSVGADALELNVYHVAADPLESGDAVEARYVALLTELRRVVDIPVVMKLSPFFSSLPHFVRRLEAAGAAGVALFNRFFQPDIDLQTREMVEQLQLSSPEEALLRIRWIAILRSHTSITLAATGGVYGHEEAMKLLLAGADVVHLASCLLAHGPAHLGHILRGMEDWMTEGEYASVAQLKASMSLGHLRDPSALVRQSYIRVLDSFTPRAGVWR